MPSNKLKVAPGQKRLGTTVQVVSRERCVFHVDRVWTSTRGEGVWPMWTHVDRGSGGRKPDFCGRHKWMAPEQRFYSMNYMYYYYYYYFTTSTAPPPPLLHYHHYSSS